MQAELQALRVPYSHHNNQIGLKDLNPTAFHLSQI